MYNIKYIIITKDHTVCVETEHNLSRKDYDNAILGVLHASYFCDITTDNSYTTIIIREK